MNDQNHKLAALTVIKDSYKNLFRHLKSYLIISYGVMLPLFLIKFVTPISIDQNAPFSWPLAFSLFAAIILLILFAIFLYRLFILSRERLFKVTANDLMNMILKSLLYSLALGAVLILAYLSLGLLFGLVLSIINSAGGNLLSADRIADIITYAIMLFMLLVLFRVQPTFISIALGDKTIAMKSAYYYTRDNNKNLLLIGLACYLPLIIIPGLLIMLDGGTNAATDSVISLLISPLNFLPYALQISAGSVIYKELVSGQLENQPQKMDITV